MTFQKKYEMKNYGFTIVELLIVIVVILILTILVASTYSGIKTKARNSQRQTAIQKIQQQLEGFFSQNGYYPSLADMNNSGWLNSSMKGWNQNLPIDPSSSSKSKQLASAPTAKSYSYQVTDSSGNSCESTDTNCAKYRLTATYEGTLNGQSSYVKSNLD